MTGTEGGVVIRVSVHLGLLAGVASLLMFCNLGGPRLWDRDEPRNAACAREPSASAWR